MKCCLKTIAETAGPTPSSRQHLLPPAPSPCRQSGSLHSAVREKQPPNRVTRGTPAMDTRGSCRLLKVGGATRQRFEPDFVSTSPVDSRPLIYRGDPHPDSSPRDFSQAASLVGEGERGPRQLQGLVGVSKHSPGFPFSSPPHPSTLMPGSTSPTPGHTAPATASLFCGLHNELIVLGVI